MCHGRSTKYDLSDLKSCCGHYRLFLKFLKKLRHGKIPVENLKKKNMRCTCRHTTNVMSKTKLQILHICITIIYLTWDKKFNK